jgi:hypothetical protein
VFQPHVISHGKPMARSRAPVLFPLCCFSQHNSDIQPIPDDCIRVAYHMQAMVPAALLVLGLIMYTGFTMPTMYMPGGSRWMAYVNPLSYAFESQMINEFHDHRFSCSVVVRRGLTTAPSASIPGLCGGRKHARLDDNVGRHVNQRQISTFTIPTNDGKRLPSLL